MFACLNPCQRHCAVCECRHTHDTPAAAALVSVGECANFELFLLLPPPPPLLLPKPELIPYLILLCNSSIDTSHITRSQWQEKDQGAVEWLLLQAHAHARLVSCLCVILLVAAGSSCFLIIRGILMCYVRWSC